MTSQYSIVPTQLNSTTTPELEREAAFFLKWGYLVVDDAITPAQVETLRAALDETFARTDSEFAHQILEEDERFDFLLDNPPVLERVTAILGNCIQLHSATARVTHPGAPDQNWHRDGPWPMLPEGTPYGSVPAQINCAYYLDETTLQNGPVVIVPGSQRAPFRPPEGHPSFPDEKFVLAKPGQAIFFDSWVFSSRRRQQFRGQPARVLDVLSKRLDEIARKFRWATRRQTARSRLATTQTVVGRNRQLVSIW